MSKRLVDKVCLITGGNSGIGLATAREFIKEGADVMITGRDAQTLAIAAEELGPKCTAVLCDVTSAEDLQKVRDAIVARYGRLDVLFANAGIGRASPLGKTSEATYHEIFDANVKGVFFTVQTMVDLMPDGGSIVLNASTAPITSAPGSSLYGASKAAVAAFARSLSADLCLRNIRVNSVSPGPIDTPVWQRTGAPPELLKAALSRIAKSVPLGRLGRAEEIAKAVLFLASDDSSFLLGANIIADGGAAGIPGAAPAYR